MRNYDDNLSKKDYEDLTKQLENLLYRINNEDISYGQVFKSLDKMANYTIGVSYDDYIKENTLSVLEYFIENEISIDELGAYIGDDVYYEATCSRLISNFEYEKSSEYFEDGIYIDNSDRFDTSYSKIKELLYQGINRNIYEACNQLSLDINELDKKDMMKIANYFDDTMYEKELEDSSFSFSKDSNELEF